MEVKIENPEISTEKLKQDWDSAIGRAILAFNNIEWLTLTFLQRLLSDDIFGSLVGFSFSKRVDLILNLIRSKKVVDDLLIEANDCFQEAKKLAETRNIIAHNPVRLGLYENKDKDAVLRLEVTHYRKKNKTVSLTDIHEYLQKIESLERKLLNIIIEIEKHIDLYRDRDTHR